MTTAAPAITPRNVAVMPGSLLRRRELWQQVADSLPRGAVLVILPDTPGAQRAALTAVVWQLRAEGRQIAIWEETAFQRAVEIQAQLPFHAMTL